MSTGAPGRDDLPAGLRRELRARYGEPHRRYHDGRHLDAVLAAVDELAGEADDLTAVRLATWFHDAVYDPTRSDNEAASARLAERLLPAYGVDEQRVAEVGRLVRLTATHDPEPNDRDGAVLCDADLAILAAARPAYDAYVREVRAEYGQLSDAGFAAGRAAVLRGLLGRDRLFRTRTGYRRWERAARTNLSRELAALAGAAAPPPAAGSSAPGT